MYQSIFKANVSFFPCKEAGKSKIQTISLGRALLADTWRAQVEALRAEADPAKRQAIKEALPCISPGGVFTYVQKGGRKSMSLITPSGFLCADIDCKPEKGINSALAGFDLKAEISRLPFVAYCGKSCGGAGYFLIIPIADPAKYRDYYKALQADAEKCGLTLDAACSSIAFKRFVSWDADPYINTAARPYSYTLPERKRDAPITPETAQEYAAKLEAIITKVEAEKLDIAPAERDWFEMCCALANIFGEAGRDYAQRLFQFYPGYTAAETDAKFTRAIESPYPAYTFGTIREFFKRSTIARDFDDIGQ